MSGYFDVTNNMKMKKRVKASLVMMVFCPLMVEAQKQQINHLALTLKSHARCVHIISLLESLRRWIFLWGEMAL